MLDLVKSLAFSVAKPLHVRFRGQKLKLFGGLVGESAKHYTLLDVGGGLGLADEFVNLYSSFKLVTVVNLCPPRIVMQLGSDSIRGVAADGCSLPFRSRAFDWVFSNAVIEHVGGREKQRSFASEIRRVARRGYFVATPNKYFPIEPHTYLPFYQFLAPSWQRRLAPFSPGFLREYEEIRLISAGELKDLFPEARVIDSGFPLFGNSLIAYYKERRDTNWD